MEKDNEKTEQEDPRPLTDEEFAEYQKKEKRKAGFFTTILDFFMDFFR